MTNLELLGAIVLRSTTHVNDDELQALLDACEPEMTPELEDAQYAAWGKIGMPDVRFNPEAYRE